MSSRFLDALHSVHVLLMDGAMGTELRRAGLAESECGEMWNLTHPEEVRAIHQTYADAGAEVLLTNTFQALSMHELPDTVWEVCEAAVRLGNSFATRGNHGFVLGSIGPILAPGHKEEVFPGGICVEYDLRAFAKVDAILLETFSDESCLRAVQILRGGANEKFEIPSVLLSLTYLRNDSGRLVTFGGKEPEFFAGRATVSGFAALGVNCGRDISISDCAEIVRRYRTETDLPLFARPNAGTPVKTSDGWAYPQTPEMMAEQLPALLEAGASMVGGCCGTTPAHIAAFREVVEAWNSRK